MLNEITAFPLPGLEIEVGTSIIDACAKLGIEFSKYPYDDYLVAYGDAQSMFGIEVNQYSLGCYGYDGPLERVEYGIDPSVINENKINFKQYIGILEKQFGMADKKMGDDFVIMTQCSGSVLAYAMWKFEFFEVYFSLYGGLRETEGPKSCVGGFSFSWTNVVAAAAASMQKQNNYIDSLHLEQMDIAQATVFKVGKLGSCGLYETHDVRAAWRAINTPLVFETPHRIKTLLENTGSAIAFIPIAAGMLVSNSHDSAVLVKGSKSGVWCENMLPAKGSGGMHLYLNGVKLQTKHSSKQIQTVVNWLSKEMAIDVNITETYDC